jgi:hypothetical protein
MLTCRPRLWFDILALLRPSAKDAKDTGSC